MPAKKVLIIGGGLGGLALAQALRGTQLQATVFERDKSPDARSQGYVILMNTETETCLETVQIEPYETTALKNVTEHVMLDHEFKELIRLPFGKGKGFMSKRWKLREVLQQRIDVKWGKQFVKYEEKGDKVIAYFEDGTTEEGDFLVGADGANSKVRQQRTQDISYEKLPVAHVVAYAPYNPSDLPFLHEILKNTIIRVKGKDGVSMMAVGFSEDNENVVAWTFNFPHPNLPEDAEGFKKVVIEQAAQHTHPEIAKLAEITPAAGMLPYRHLCYCNPLTEFPLGQTTRVTLIGDAMHAMTPHAGLGGNTALKDAIDLANALKSAFPENNTDNNWRECVSEYEKILTKRGFEAVTQSVNNTMSLSGLAPPTELKLANMYSISSDNGVTKAESLVKK